MSFNPNIPQATDRIADSQPQLLANFTQLNTVYGTAGDHYAWNNATPAEQNHHAKVTLPGLPTTNAPGAVLPAPGAGSGAMYAQTVNAQTYPFWRRDGIATDYPMFPIKAYGMFTAANPVVTTFANNCTIARTGAGVYQVTFTNPMPNANYGVMTTVQGFPSGIQNRFACPVTPLAASFTIRLLNYDGTFPVENGAAILFSVMF